MVEITCGYCGKTTHKSTGHYNRARKLGAGLYCSKQCSSDAKRDTRPLKEKREEKRLYDIEYRAKNKEMLKAKKADYFKRDYAENPEKYKAIRQKRMKGHVEYCRQPKYKEYKKQYDRQYRCKKKYGPMAEAASVLIDLEQAVRVKISKYESMKERKVLNKALQRSRNEKVKRSYT